MLAAETGPPADGPILTFDTPAGDHTLQGKKAIPNPGARIELFQATSTLDDFIYPLKVPETVAEANEGSAFLYRYSAKLPSRIQETQMVEQSGSFEPRGEREIDSGSDHDDTLSASSATCPYGSDIAVGNGLMPNVHEIGPPGVFYRCDISAPWRMSFVSDGVKELTGYPASHVQKFGWASIIHVDDLGALGREISSAVAAGLPFVFSYRLIHKSGAVKVVTERGKAIFDEDGVPLYLEGQIFDNTGVFKPTDLKWEARNSAEEFAAKLNQVLECTSDCVFSLSRDWRITFANGRAAAETLPRENLIGRKLTDIYPQLENTPFMPAYREVMATGEPRHIIDFIPGLDNWYEAYAAPTIDGITVFFRNINDRKQAEDLLRDKEDHFRKILDHIPQMVWSTLPNGDHDYYSRPWYDFTGAPLGSTDGKGWNNMFHSDDQKRARRLWKRSLQSGEPYEIEYRLRHHTGQYRWVLGRAWPERNSEGQIVRWYGTCTDIHDRVTAEQSLRQSEIFQQSILDASADSIKILHVDGALEFMNGPGVEAMELESFEEIEGKDWACLWPDTSQNMVRSAVEEAAEGRAARFSSSCTTAKGHRKWWDVIVSPIVSDQGEVTRLLSISRDITALRDTSDQLQWASEHDALTSLPNRRAFEARLRAATIRAMERDSMLGVLLLDLDHFKHVNDTLGHAAGDYLLKTFAERLTNAARESDFVARLGGDEFAIVMENVEGENDLLPAGDNILKQLQVPVSFENRMVSTSASIGGALFPNDASNANDLLKNADTALYALKASGRGGTRMFHSHMREEAQRIASQLSLARTAVNDCLIVPYYQQKVHLPTGRRSGFEALLRWNHSSRGIQLPGTLEEAFKDYDLSSKLGELMQNKIFDDIVAWRRDGIEFGHIAINAAPAEFLRDDYAEGLLRRLAEHNLPANLIEIEVTEHVFFERGFEFVGRALKRLKEAGIRIALDDFGTGHSSLSHLRDFPVDVVKIDRSFVEQMTSNQEIRAIVHAVIDLGRSLAIEVVAEGIETADQLQSLRNRGCGYGQGWFFGRAVAADKVGDLIGVQEQDCA